MTQVCQQEKCSKSHYSCISGPYKGLGRLSYSAGDSMTGSERFGANLREWRLRRRLTQEELGAKVGADGPRVGRLEKGSENPTLETIDKLGIALDVDVSLFHVPRPEDEAAYEGGRPRQHLAVFEDLITTLDAEFPAADSWEGDIYKAIAALNRALRRGPDSGTAGAPPATARR